ncbi:MAG: glycoside hydrolase family 97 catalytic domain-containing protein [Bacteroidales bacterium]|nr:glycoside hydrolase family 97 catalytic domain-containing protein [Bacteroidales bacterium]
MKISNILMFLLALANLNKIAGNEHYMLLSPNKKIAVEFWLTTTGEPVYAVSHSETIVLRESKLGLVRSDNDFSTQLSIDSVSDVETISEKYKLLHGKRLNCSYTANKKVFYLRNRNLEKINIIFQASNDGIAFRYYFPEKKDTAIKIYKEVTSYHFNNTATSFLQPSPDARMEWHFTTPSYEEYYKLNKPVGTVAPNQAGWVMPALFHDGQFWVCITETAVDTNYCGSRLSQFSPDGEYTVQFPQPQEGKSGEPVLPTSTTPWITPWRIVAITDNLADMVESTLETDLAIPARYDVSSWLEPGIASWSWVILKDDSTIYSTQKRYIDFAATMNWQYCLIDAFWDAQIGYDKIQELANYAKTKDVKILLWYNSAGDWNTTLLTPRDKLLTHESRSKEFQKLKDMGIAGIKVDFFGGDGQSMMRYYANILTDAAKYNLAVNFHGSTFPRGWHRTYPNLVSMEAIRGEEFVTFGQEGADKQPAHCTVIPFTRNLFDPMDFTPVNFSGIPNLERRTTKGFEIALSVLFTSGIQHLAETPTGMTLQKDFVINYMQTLPTTWDDVKFIDGYPGKYVVLARKKDDTWFIAGINGEKSERTITLHLPFVDKKSEGVLIADMENAEDLTESKPDFSSPITISMHPYGGFVIKTK